MKKKKDNTVYSTLTSKNRPKPSKTYLRELQALDESEITQAARADLDNPPLTDAQFQRAYRPWVPVQEVRTKLQLTQKQFAEKFRIPLATLKDWEQSRYAPDQAARNYLQLIAYDAKFVSKALEHRA
jgi:putative transcriptional regulator